MYWEKDWNLMESQVWENHVKNLAALLSASHTDTEPQSHVTFGYFQPHMCKGPPACMHHWRPLTFLWCTQTSAHLNSCLLLGHFSLRSMATHTEWVCFHTCSPELPSCPGVALSRASQHGCFKSKQWRSYQANSLHVSFGTFYGISYSGLCEGVVWRPESLSEQVHATCSCSILAVFLLGRRECHSGLGCSSMAPDNAAAYTQALLIHPASHTEYLVFFACQATLVFAKLLYELEFRGVFAQICFWGTLGR